MTVSSRRAFGYVMCIAHAVKLVQHKSDSVLLTANKTSKKKKRHIFKFGVSDFDCKPKFQVLICLIFMLKMKNQLENFLQFGGDVVRLNANCR